MAAKTRKPAATTPAPAAKPEPQPVRASETLANMRQYAAIRSDLAAKKTAAMVEALTTDAADAIRWRSGDVIRQQTIARLWRELMATLDERLAGGHRLTDVVAKWLEIAAEEARRIAERALDWADNQSTGAIHTAAERLQTAARAEFYGVKSWGGDTPAHEFRAILKAHEAGLLIDDVSTPQADA
jgi:hypothetical protein